MEAVVTITLCQKLKTATPSFDEPEKKGVRNVRQRNRGGGGGGGGLAVEVKALSPVQVVKKPNDSKGAEHPRDIDVIVVVEESNSGDNSIDKKDPEVGHLTGS